MKMLFTNAEATIERGRRIQEFRNSTRTDWTNPETIDLGAVYIEPSTTEEDLRHATATTTRYIMWAEPAPQVLDTDRIRVRYTGRMRHVQLPLLAVEGRPREHADPLQLLTHQRLTLVLFEG